MNNKNTEIKNSELESLRIDNEQFKAIIENTSDLTVIIDNDGNYSYISPAAEHIYDYPAHKVIGKNIKDFIHPDDMETVTNIIKRCRTDNRSRKIDRLRIQIRNNTLLYLESIVTSMINNSTINGIVVNCRDITDRVHAEEKIFEQQTDLMAANEELEAMVEELNATNEEFEATNEELISSQNQLLELNHTLQVKEEFFRAITEKSSDLTIVINNNNFITYISPSISSYGLTQKDLINTNIFLYIHKDDQDAIRKAIHDSEKISNSILIEDIRFTNSMNNFNNMETIVTSLMKNSSVEGIILNCRDITKRLIAEAELLKKKKIESIGILAGGIAHDFNNLLTAVIGNISLAKVSSDKKSEVHDILLEAEKASIRAKDLTHQLLTFSQGGDPIKKITNICELIKDTAGFILRGSSIRCDYSIEKNLHNANIDAGQISQVIYNLIINAKQSMPGGGVITVSAKNINHSIEKLNLHDNSYVEISISDHGIGIPKESIKNIFDPYYTTKENGNGLGLAVCYSIIKKHNGLIDVKSKASEGSTFTIYLPSTDAAPEKIKNKDLPKSQYEAKILIMDDNHSILDVACKIIKHLGYQIETSADGLEAISKYKKAFRESNPFDIVIMDLTIPGNMGGKEAIKILKEFDPNVKAIVSSGYSNDPVMASYTDYGFIDVVAKPYRLEELEQVLNRVLNTCTN